MDQPMTSYWNKRLADLKVSLESNNFDVFVADDRDDAYKIVMEDIIPPLNARTISWGGSVTFKDTGLYRQLKDHASLEVLDTFEKKFRRTKCSNAADRPFWSTCLSPGPMRSPKTVSW